MGFGDTTGMANPACVRDRFAAAAGRLSGLEELLGRRLSSHSIIAGPIDRHLGLTGGRHRRPKLADCTANFGLASELHDGIADRRHLSRRPRSQPRRQ